MLHLNTFYFALKYYFLSVVQDHLFLSNDRIFFSVNKKHLSVF